MLELTKVSERSVTTEELLADPDAEGGDTEAKGKTGKAKKKKSAKGKAK